MSQEKSFFWGTQRYPQPTVFSGALERGSHALELEQSGGFTSQVVLSPVVIGQCCLFPPWFLAVRVQTISA